MKIVLAAREAVTCRSALCIFHPHAISFSSPTMLTSAVTSASTTGPAMITEAADKKWRDWYLRLRALDDPKNTRRLDTIGLRLMPILAHTSDKSEVDEEIVDHVIAILDYSYQVRKLYAPIDALGEIAKLEARISKQLQARGELSNRALARYVNASRYGQWKFRQALENLEQAGLIVHHSRRAQPKLSMGRLNVIKIVGRCRIGKLPDYRRLQICHLSSAAYITTFHSRGCLYH
jgi:DNA replicative helicase MCM subunit Mcm2 (Cdc46/Mcm family)